MQTVVTSNSTIIAVASLAVALAGVIAGAIGGWHGRRHQSTLARERDEETRRQHAHARLAELYREVHDAGNDLIVSLRLHDAFHLPRPVRVAHGMLWLRRGSPIRQIGHRRAMLELHGVPDAVLDAWKRVDETTTALAEAQMTTDGVDAAVDEVRSALGTFVAAAAHHLEEVWPTRAVTLPDLDRDDDRRDTTRQLTERGPSAGQSWAIAGTAAAAALLLNQLTETQAPTVFGVLALTASVPWGLHLGRAQGGRDGGIRLLWHDSSIRLRAVVVLTLLGVAAGGVLWGSARYGAGYGVFLVGALLVMVWLMWPPPLDESTAKSLTQFAAGTTRASAAALVLVLLTAAFLGGPYLEALPVAGAGAFLAYLGGWAMSRLQARSRSE